MQNMISDINILKYLKLKFIKCFLLDLTKTRKIAALYLYYFYPRLHMKLE